MSKELSTTGAGELLQSLVIQGDLSKLNEGQKVQYYMELCRSLGLNPVTQPFALLKFQGKEVLYAKKDATEQLRKIHGISVTDLVGEDQHDGTYVVTCNVKDKSGKTDISTGVVSTEGLKGEALGNKKMVAETKSKRRATLSICGLGMLDESEVSSVDANAVVMDISIPKHSKQALSEKGFGQAMERIHKGERELIGKLRSTYLLTQAQSDTLLAIEDANTVTA
jgi:hypothetical protein